MRNPTFPRYNIEFPFRNNEFPAEKFDLPAENFDFSRENNDFFPEKHGVWTRNQQFSKILKRSINWAIGVDRQNGIPGLFMMV
jgi:hypothetical protein